RVRPAARPAASGVAASALTALGAGGRRPPPLPPGRGVRRVVGDLTAVEREGGVELTWTVPRRRFDNSRILDPGVARLHRIDDAGTGDPRAAMLRDDHVVGYTEIETFRLQEPTSSYLRGSRIIYIDRRGLVYGRRYTYVATTTDAQGRTGPPSARVSITYIAPPEPPRARRGRRPAPADGAGGLRGAPPATLVDGSAVADQIAYEVLRATDPVAPLSTIARTTTGLTAFEDRGLENDRTYYYAVRAV